MRRREHGAALALFDWLGLAARAGVLVGAVGLTLALLGLLHG